MGFSIVGLLIALAVLAPNALLLAFPPEGGIPKMTDAGIVFTVLERAGQVGCLALLAFSGTAPLDGWLIGSVACILAYWALWARYVVRGRHFGDLYSRVWFMPVPMAVFPVLAFAFAALWLGSPWLAIAVLALAIGHLANSLHVARTLTADSPPGRSAPGR